MSDLPRQPQGRYKRMWMEFEVEVVDEMALRTFDLHAMNDEKGEFAGLVEMDDNERVQWALSFLAIQAWNAAEPSTGVRFIGGSGPAVRYLNADGRYEELNLPSFPVRRDDGELAEEWPPRA